MRILDPVRRHPIVAYVLLALGLSSAYWIPMSLRGKGHSLMLSEYTGGPFADRSGGLIASPLTSLLAPMRLSRTTPSSAKA
jgi:hypothetical protein